MLNVAAYCRVSTDKSDQANSFASQKRYFEEYINRNPDWELTEIYADEGLTGTNTKKRKAFNKMIADAHLGRFDMIITKEVSRFARNTVDTLQYTRELKAINIGVLFMLDNIDTLAPDGEAKYEPIKNYIGKYTYNGIVEKTEDEDGETVYAFQPNRISIDMFLDELKGYLKDNGVVEFTVENETYPNGEGAEYYQRGVSQYYKDGDLKKEVDYSKFLYYEGKIAGFENFDVNKIFESGSRENAAMSVINELSFAYNTDTAGLNTYLGYAVSPNNTDFVKEFEYAAQRAVAGGAGTITVAPSDYGWHIMYCTFSYSGNNTPYRFDWNDIEKEGTFSNLYYEALKASNLESYSTDLRASIITSFDNDACVTLYENRYKDLWEN